jgi:hypothetical protein
MAKGMYKIFLALLLSILSVQAGLSRLEALSMIESGDNDYAIGGAGEVSRYQIKPNVWRLYSGLRDYQDKQLSGFVARQYLSSLERSFEKRAGHPPTDFDIYVLWNAGFTYYARLDFSAQRVSRLIGERARRFVNLRQMPNGPQLTARTGSEKR